MEQEIKNILAKYSSDKQYFEKLTNIKKIIDEEYQELHEEQENKKINDKIIKYIETLKCSTKESNELKKLKIKKNYKNSYENIVDYHIDLRYSYDIYSNNKYFAIQLDVFGESDDNNLCFSYKNYDDEVAIVSLHEDLKFKNVSIEIFLRYVLYLLKNDYEHEIFDYCFLNYEDTYNELKEEKIKKEEKKKKEKKNLKNYNKNINKDIQDFFN